MKKRITALLLIAVLLAGCFAGCGKDDKPVEGTSETTGQPAAAQTKYAYKAEYLPLDLTGEQIRYINDFCISGENMFLTASCVTGTEVLVDEITGEPYLDENGQPIETDVTATYLFVMDLASRTLRRLDYTMPQPAEGQFGYGYTGGLTAAADGTVWFYDQLRTYRYDLPEEFDPETGNAYEYYVDEGAVIVCRHYDAQGAELAAIPLEVAPEIYMSDVKFLADGSIYGTDWMNIYRYDSQGMVAGTLPLENGFNNFVTMSEGIMGVSLWEESGMVIKPLDAAAMTLGEGIALPDNAYNLLPGVGGYDYLYESNSAIYGFTGAGEPEKLFSWLDCDVDNSNMNGYEILPDGTVYALETVYSEDSTEYSLIVMKQVDASTLPQKQVLTLACMYLDWDVRSDIIAFNKSHDDVRITVADYSQYATDEGYYAGLQKLNTEILSGVVPDLFFIDENMPVAVYGAKGVLQDLWPLIDTDPELSREDLMLHFFESICMDGKLYQIVDTFAIETAVGRSDVVGTADSWTLEELLTVYETLEPGASIFGEMDVKEQMLSTIIERSSNSFVDWENSHCSFDSQEFIDLLDFVNAFPTEFDHENYDWNSYTSEGLRMRTGLQLLQQAYVSSFDSVQYYNAMTDGAANYIGFPTTDGNGSNFRIYGGLAISASCANTEAAWEFVRQYLTEEHQLTEYMYQFPTNRHAFEAYVQDCMTPVYGERYDYGIAVDTAVPTLEITVEEEAPEEEAGKEGQTEQPRGSYWFSDEEIVKYYAMTQAEYDSFMALYEKTASLASYNENINEIIRQECEAFFAGQKTALETAKLIQDRATLYVFEQG